MDYEKAWKQLKVFVEGGVNHYNAINHDNFFEGKYCAYVAVVDEMHNIEVSSLEK